MRRKAPRRRGRAEAAFSIRLPKASLLDFSKSDCVGIPIQIRREVSQEFAKDLVNVFRLDFTIAISKGSLFESQPVLTVDPSYWGKSTNLIEVLVPVCKVIFGTSQISLEGSSLILGLTLKYTRDLTALQGESSKCTQVLISKCIISTRYTTGISIVTNSLLAIQQPTIYDLEIKKLQDFLDSKPCFPGGVGNQLLSNIYCANASQSVQILSKAFSGWPFFTAPSTNCAFILSNTDFCFLPMALRSTSASPLVNPAIF